MISDSFCGGLCEDCPPRDYPTNDTRCQQCPLASSSFTVPPAESAESYEASAALQEARDQAEVAGYMREVEI